MAFFTQNKFNYTTGVPDGDGIYPSESSTWGDDGAGVLGNGTIAFPTAAGGAGEVLTDVAGNGTLTFASVPSTPPSGILGSVQLSDGAGGFTSDQPSFNYNSTTKRLGIGKVATTSLDVFHDDIDVNALLENVSASFDEIAVGLKLKHRSTNSMDPGLGIAQEYYIEDDTSGELLAGSITFQRQSADALRKFVVKGGTNGTQELFSIDSNREFTIEGGLRSGFGFGFTPPANSLAWNINNAGASVIIGNGGSGLGLRVLANLGNILSLEDTNQVAQVLVSNTGLVTFNDAANATADFEVLAETTGTALFVDVSTGRVGFGTTSPSGIIHTVASSPPLFERRNASNNALQAGLDLLHKASVNALDGLGPSLRFGLQDDTSAYEVVGEIGAVRDGADNEGKLVFRAGTNGNEHMVSIEASGKSVFNVSTLSTGDFQVLSSSAGNSIYSKASTGFTGFGTHSPVGIIHTVASSPPLFQRENSSSSTPQAGLDLLHKTSVNALDGVGPSLRFGLQDDTSAYEVLGEIAAVRDGADDEGKIIFKAGTNGNEHMVSISANGKTTFNEAALSGGDFEILRQTTGTLFKADVSANTLALFKDTADVRGLGVNTLTVNGESNTPIIEFNTDRADTDGSLIGLLTFTYDPYTNKNLGAYGVALDGSTVGNRGSKFQVFTKKDASALALVNFEIRESGKINMNPSFLSGANIEVGASGSGTAAFFDIVGKQWIIGSKVVRADTDLALDHSGVLTLAERSTTPTAIASYGKVYAKSDDKLYFQDGAGTEHEIAFV